MNVELIHAGLGWPIASALALLSFASSFITVAFGIGGGAVMLAAMAVLLPAAAIIPVHGLVQLGSNAGRLSLMVRHVERAVLPAFVVGAVAGVVVGGSMVVQLPAGAIQLGVGLFILWSVFFRPPAILRRSGGFTGLFSSFLTMFFGGTGPFVATFVKAQELEPMRHVATHAALMTVQHLLKILVFGILGFAFAQWIGFIALLICAGFLGTVAGRHVLTKMDQKRFALALNVVLALLALRLIWSGGGELLSG